MSSKCLLQKDSNAYDHLCTNSIYFSSHHSLRNPACLKQFSSYRATFELPQGVWKTIRLPWSEFTGYGPGPEKTPFEASALRRIGIVAIGKEMEVCLALGGLRFYSVI